jgi:hypothetical protein
MVRDRGAWLDEDGDLQVFVPGLMATGILVSICMFIWDGVKRFLPDVGRRQRAARVAMNTSGRVSDLVSVESGEAPAYARVQRVRRTRGIALLLAIGSLVTAAVISYLTVGIYMSGSGTLAGRGWTLSMGFGLAGAIAVAGLVWLTVALMDERLPAWLERTQMRWPIGVLPEPSEDA